MKQDSSKIPELQVLVCTRQKEKGSCCADKGAKDIHQNLKLWMKDNNLKGPLKVTATQCLGHCESGVAMAFQPQNEWFTNVSEEDLPQIKEEISKRI